MKKETDVDDKFDLEHSNVAVEMIKWVRLHACKKGLNKRTLCKKA